MASNGGAQPRVSFRVSIMRIIYFFPMMYTLTRFECSESSTLTEQLVSSSLSQRLAPANVFTNGRTEIGYLGWKSTCPPVLSLRGGKAKKKRRERKHVTPEDESEVDSDESSMDDSDDSGDARAANVNDSGSEEEEEDGADRKSRGPRLLRKTTSMPKEDEFDWEAYKGEEPGAMLKVTPKKTVDKLGNIDISAGIERTHKPIAPKQETKRERQLKAANKKKGEDDEDDEDEDAEMGEGRKGKGKGDALRLSKKEKKEARKALRRGMPSSVDIRNPAGSAVPFGHATADLQIGEAFEDRVGTQRLEDNKFFLPKHLEEEYIVPCDPEGALTADQQAQRLRKEEEGVQRDSKKRKKEEGKAERRGRGVMYVGNFPDGFYDDEQFQFFSQYGEVTRLRLARHKKSGMYKRYGFVEFRDRAVANKVVHEMDGHMLSGKKLACRLLPTDDVHPDLFKGCKPGQRVARFKQVDWREVERKRQSRKRTLLERIRLMRKRIRLFKSRQSKLRRNKAMRALDLDGGGAADPLTEMRAKLSALLEMQSKRQRRARAAAKEARKEAKMEEAAESAGEEEGRRKREKESEKEEEREEEEEGERKRKRGKTWEEKGVHGVSVQ